jgi:hypothetical protein
MAMNVADKYNSPKLHEKLWDIYTANTVSWVSAKRLYEDDTQHVTDLCKMGSIDLAIGK